MQSVVARSTPLCWQVRRDVADTTGKRAVKVSPAATEFLQLLDRVGQQSENKSEILKSKFTLRLRVTLPPVLLNSDSHKQAE